MDAGWILKSYSEVLNVERTVDFSISIEIDALCEMVDEHTSMVLECFVKVSELLKQSENTFIQPDKASTIINAGLKSKDPKVRKDAEISRENLLTRGFDLI